MIRNIAPIDRVSAKAGVAFASVLEYPCTGDIAKEDGFKRIKPRHITMALKNDPLKLFSGNFGINLNLRRKSNLSHLKYYHCNKAW